MTKLALFEARADEAGQDVCGSYANGCYRPDVEGEKQVAKLSGWCDALRWVLKNT